MSIKSKKWYDNQIRCLTNAADYLENSIRTTMQICHNNISEGFSMTKSDRKKLDDTYTLLNKLKDERWLYHRR